MEIKLSKQRVRQLPPATKKVADHRLENNTVIRNHKILDKTRSETAQEHKQHFIATEDVVDDVEYLEEQGIGTGEEEVGGVVSNIDFVDTFYQNAIHCLIALYREQYHEMQGQSVDQIKRMHVWDHIVRAMNESYFNFSAEQVKRKFGQLRRLYFSVSSIEEIDALEYFDELHEIYQDRIIDALASGEVNCRTVEQRGEKLKVYADEALQQEALDVERQISEPLLVYPNISEIVDVHADVQQNEIAHKEHEFINMMEKELQAIETHEIHRDDTNQPSVAKRDEMLSPQQQGETLQLEHKQLEISITGKTKEQLTADSTQNSLVRREQMQSIPAKRLKFVVPILQVNNTQGYAPPADGVPVTGETKNTVLPLARVGVACQTDNNQDMSLSEYNVEQERRHQVQIELMQRHMNLQEHAVEMQCMLLEQLIKHTH